MGPTESDAGPDSHQGSEQLAITSVTPEISSDLWGATLRGGGRSDGSDGRPIMAEDIDIDPGDKLLR